jgi:hypothetical protein
MSIEETSQLQNYTIDPKFNRTSLMSPEHQYPDSISSRNILSEQKTVVKPHHLSSHEPADSNPPRGLIQFDEVDSKPSKSAKEATRKIPKTKKIKDIISDSEGQGTGSGSGEDEYGTNDSVHSSTYPPFMDCF